MATEKTHPKTLASLSVKGLELPVLLFFFPQQYFFFQIASKCCFSIPTVINGAKGKRQGGFVTVTLHKLDFTGKIQTGFQRILFEKYKSN